MVSSCRTTALVTLALLAFPFSSSPRELPPGVGQWIGAIRAMREDTQEVKRVHLRAMRYVDGSILSAELAMVCRAVELAARDVRTRSRANSDTAAGRVRRAVLPLIADRLWTRHECVPGRALPGPGPGVDLPTLVHEAVGLLDLAPSEVVATERALQAEELRDGDMEEAVTELGDWLTRHDELVRKLAAMNLALRHAHHGHLTGAGKRAFEQLEKALEDSDDLQDDGPTHQVGDPPSMDRAVSGT